MKKCTASFVGLATLLCACLAAKYHLDADVLPQAKARRPEIQVPLAGYQGQKFKRYTFGFDNLVSSLIWIDLLQKAQTTPVPDGKLSWEFMQLDTITELDPRFERAYRFGSTFVSTLRRDKMGGKLLLEKWVRKNPTLWRTHYALGIHLFQEFHDYNAAAPRILKAASLPRAPEWLTSLGVRLLSESGGYLHALKSAVALHHEVRSPDAKYRLKQRIRSLNLALKKSAWKDALESYRKRAHKEPSSLTDLQSDLRGQTRHLSSAIAEEDLDEEIKSLLSERFEFFYNSKSRLIEVKLSPYDQNIEQLGIYHEGK